MFLKPVLPVIEYVVNYEYVSKVLCINKDKPKLQCNGKCYLMKELANASENEKPISSDKKFFVQENEILFFQEIKALVVDQIYFCKTIYIEDNYENLYYHAVSCSIFHPPTIIS